MPGLASADSYSGSNLRVALMNGGLRGTRTSGPLKNVDSMDLRRDIVIPRDLSSRSRDHISTADDEDIAAEESLSHYCKPVELYNIIQKRLARQPLFLQRCLSYKISAAHQRSMKMTVAATGFSNSRGSAWGTLAKVSGKELGSNDLVFGRQSYSVLVMVTSPVKDLTKEGQFAYRLRKPKVLVVGQCSDTDVESSQSSVTFILPETRKLLLNAKRGDVVLFIVMAQEGRHIEASEAYLALANCSGRITWGKVAFTSICQMWLKSTREYSRMSIETRDPRDPREHSHVTTTNVDLKPGKLQHDNSEIEPSILLSSSTKVTNDRSLVRLQIRFIGEEAGHSNLVSRNTNGTLPSKTRAGRIVFHYLYDHGTRRKTEVTEEFSCPFCLSHCASFKGLEFHLNATHDLFNFEYLVSGDLQIVIVSIRSDVPLGPSGVLRSLDLDGPRSKEFIYWWPRSRSRRRKVPIKANVETMEKIGVPAQSLDLEKVTDANSVQDGVNVEEPHSTDEVVSKEIDTPPEIMEGPGNLEQQLQVGVNLDVGEDDSLSNGSNGLMSTGSDATADMHQRKEIGYKAQFQQNETRAGKVPDGENLGHIVKQRSVSAQKRQRMKGVLGERAQARARPNSTQGGACAAAAGAPIEDCALQPSALVPNRALPDRPDLSKSHASLQKRQYFHSHTAQPMDAEQLFGDRDSEDEVDAAIADLEDRRMLDDFVDVTGEEKEVMHLWNSFVRRNRVLADGHCPWACKEFTRENAQRFGTNPALRRCLMLFLVKLWNHHLVDGPTITSCLSIADAFDTQEPVSPKQ
ncbi:polycomb protein SUZ12 [Marchantia polymorpha subsp. ruderalis]|uniref:Polycomb protein VEFS-Box domain-containing protein n=4 Tax=Marchantia polymorpha TaxID=3197 RepID=A0AAF6BHQ2_MARPO|nr:hypothetical protein MARPO_0092s0032 [Marchantia polymorpha]BBN11536.1 hypothetical protein Mp_5g12760 [Marchantia polymorpha subsp. ruderalis]|eukprot:PTQ33063.1 hypothetical protein MARPO_0092s0032 [Marchantia polymorpha]